MPGAVVYTRRLKPANDDKQAQRERCGLGAVQLAVAEVERPSPPVAEPPDEASRDKPQYDWQQDGQEQAVLDWGGSVGSARVVAGRRRHDRCEHAGNEQAGDAGGREADSEAAQALAATLGLGRPPAGGLVVDAGGRGRLAACRLLLCALAAAAGALGAIKRPSEQSARVGRQHGRQRACSRPEDGAGRQVDQQALDSGLLRQHERGDDAEEDDQRECDDRGRQPVQAVRPPPATSVHRALEAVRRIHQCADGDQPKNDDHGHARGQRRNDLNREP